MTGYTVSMSRGLGIGACVAILTIAGVARAQDAAEPLAVAYEAPEGCPRSEAFFQEISARTTKARAAQPNERARVMHVVVTRSGGQHEGRLWIEDASASSTARSVSGKTCGEVISALALIGALAVDPRASTAPIAAPPIATDQAGAAPADARGPAASPPAATPLPAAASPPAAPVPARAPDAEAGTSPPAGPAGPRGRIEVGVQAEVSFMAGAVASGRLFGDLSIGPRGGLFAPAIRIAITRSLDVDRTAAIGGATLHWTTGGLDVCPVRIALARLLALRPCGGGSVGVVDASGTGFAGTVSRSRPWATLSALGRLVWEPLPFLDLELEAGVIAALYRESFFFAPNVAVYEAPPAALLSRAGFGLRFP